MRSLVATILISALLAPSLAQASPFGLFARIACAITWSCNHGAEQRAQRAHQKKQEPEYTTESMTIGLVNPAYLIRRWKASNQGSPGSWTGGGSR